MGETMTTEWVIVPRGLRDEVRAQVADILETVARDGLPGPRDLDVALDAIGCAITDGASPVPPSEPVGWRTIGEAAAYAVGELMNPDASDSERMQAADILRKAVGMPMRHAPDCAVNADDFDGDGNDCTCGYWDTPASPVPPSEPVGWRWRVMADPLRTWVYWGVEPKPGVNLADEIVIGRDVEIEPLYSHPSPGSVPVEPPTKFGAIYDRPADVLYLTIKCEAAVSEEGPPGFIWRRNPDTREIVGLTIMDFSTVPGSVPPSPPRDEVVEALRTPDSLIEAVARALEAADIDNTATVDLARAALLAIEASGHAVVPMEPTQEMIRAGGPHATSPSCYDAMLSARPRVT